MSRMFPELDAVRIEVEDGVRRSHLGTIQAALRARSAPRRGRGHFLAVAVGLVLLLPVVAMAADNSVPGDILYPLKRVVEPVVVALTDEPTSERRVREVEVLFERGSPDEVVQAHLAEVRQVVARDEPELLNRIEDVRADLETRRPASGTPPNADRQPTVANEKADTEVLDDGIEPRPDATTTTTLETSTSIAPDADREPAEGRRSRSEPGR